MSEFFVELLCEEIPARFQKQATADFERLFSDALRGENLTFKTIKAFMTPRRMSLVVTDLPLVQEDQHLEVKGPKADAPQKAIDGFLASNGITLDEATLQDTPKGQVYFYTKTVKGQKIEDLLKTILEKVILTFPWPKSMRWGSAAFAWVRPMTQIMAYFNGKALQGTFDLQGREYVLKTNTPGHRYLGKGVITPKNFDDYVQKLEDQHVLLDAEKRSAFIQKQLEKIAKDKGLKIRENDGLLAEVTGLVEWPHALLGTIEDRFVDLPEEILVTSMRVHQRYFPLEDENGKMAPYFIVVANALPDDNGEAIVKGNERVLRARLSDARFFYDLDLKTRLDNRFEPLKKIVFHAKLGTVFERTQRLSNLSNFIAKRMGLDAQSQEHAARAGLLCKTDLVTEVVQEFPEIQGVMGGYYARHDGEADAVAEAIALHYNPKGPSDSLPETPIADAVALAEKVDAIVGFFGVGLKPTGSKDPFALRRAALGIVRIMLNTQLTFSLKDVFFFAFDAFGPYLKPEMRAQVIDDIFAFLNDRLRVFFKEQGLRHDVISAVLAQDDFISFAAMERKMRALDDFLKDENAGALVGLYKRALNISEKSDAHDNLEAVNQNKLVDKAEKGLYAALDENGSRFEKSLDEGRYAEALDFLLQLEKPVATFFEEVFVNAEDAALKHNRLCLLQGLVARFHDYADFSKIEGV